MPRELHVAIAAIDINEESAGGRTYDISMDFKNRNSKTLFFMRNKAPRWNEAVGTYLKLDSIALLKFRWQSNAAVNQKYAINFRPNRTR